MKAEDIKRIMDAVEKVAASSKIAGQLQEKANRAEMNAVQAMDTIESILRANADKEGGEAK